jgi:hypothetical protein
MKKKIILGFGALATAVAIIPLFAAFEAHVINVTARIENALSVDTSALNFGTVFPQEQLDKPLNIQLSQSFIDEGRVDDVEYMIRQKPKCAITTNEGQDADLENTATGHVTQNQDGSVSIDCGPAPRQLTGEETWGVLPSLCPYLSKHKNDNDEQAQEVELDAFHQPFATSTNGIVWTEARGYLTKIGNDVIDNWTIDLKVPCFGNFCAQDWAGFVHGINPDADPTKYTQPIANEHKVFGCDLWVEVTGVSRNEEPGPTPTPTPSPTVGALLSAYVQPTGQICNINVDDNITGETSITDSSINGGIAKASNGQTVCVGDGTYNEDVVINKEIILAGNGATNTSTINGQATGQGAAVTIAANNVTLKGFNINGAGIAALWLNTGVSGANVHHNHLTSAAGVTALTTQGSQSNSVFNNNKFTGNASGQVAYVNGTASLGQASDNVDFTNNTFDGTVASGGVVLGNEATNSSIDQNIFNSSGSTYGLIETFTSATTDINQNNLNAGGSAVIKVRNGDNGAALNVENNWWGDIDPSDNIFQNVDFTPFAASAFPEN